MVLLLLLVFYYLFVDASAVKISAEKLSSDYNLNPKAADKKYLNKEIETTGLVKAYYEFENENNLLELNPGKNNIGIYCILLNSRDEDTAAELTKDTKVAIRGVCLGLKDGRFPNSIYIEVVSIK